MTVLAANRYAGFGIRRTRNGPVGRLFEMRVEFGFERAMVAGATSSSMMT
jgi:hypothetical protein